MEGCHKFKTFVTFLWFLSTMKALLFLSMLETYSMHLIARIEVTSPLPIGPAVGIPRGSVVCPVLVY